MAKKKYPSSEFDNPMNQPSKGRIEQAGHEIKSNPPAILAHTAKKFGSKKAKAQKIAIMLSKARKKS